MKTIRLLFITACLLLPGTHSTAHEGHDHESHAEATPLPMQNKSWRSVFASSELFEAVLRYTQIEKGKETTMRFFLSDFETNAPISNAVLKAICREDKSIAVDVRYLSAGTFELHATFPEDKVYSLAMNIIAGPDADLLLLQGIKVGFEPVLAETEQGYLARWPYLAILVVGVLAGMFLMYLIKRRKKEAALCITLLLSLPANFSYQAVAHGGDDHSHAEETKEKPMSGIGLAADEMEILKETQFLFTVRTEYVKKTNYYTLVKLYGKVMPAIDGEARIFVPQGGTLKSIHVNIGQHVQRGQLMAVISQNLTAAEQIQLMNERNNALAEFENAKKDYLRLKKLEDVIAAKDLQAAEIRLENAERNKQTFSDGESRNLRLTAPIEGVVDNFNLTVGQQLAPNDQLFVLYNTHKLKVEAQIFDKDFHALNHPDQPGEVSQYRYYVECIQEREHFSEFAKLISFGKSVNPVNQASQVILELDNKSELFKPGQFANVEIQGKGTDHQIVIPTSAVSDINGKPAVFVHTAPEIFRVKFVKTGKTNGNTTVILQGLEEKERVVVNGTYQVKSIYINQ